MKVALVSPYDLLRPGGVNSHIRHLARHLRSLGCETKIIAPSSTPMAADEGTIVAPGGVVPLIVNGASAHIGLSPAAFRWIGRVLDGESFDVVHTHEPLVPFLPLAALWRSTAVNVGTFHAHYTGTRLHALARPFLKPFFERLDARIAVSPAAMRSVYAQFPGRYKIVPLAIDLASFQQGGPRLREFDDGKVNILFVGRLDPRKGVDHLLAAFGELHRELPDTRLIVAAPHDQSAEQRYLSRTAALGLTPADVAFVGPVPQEELPRYYRAADIYCSPALGGESFGMVLLEAMAAGKPIVASRIGGYRELVREWHEALLVPPGDPAALAAALTLLVREGDLRRRLGEEGRRTAARYDWPHVARQIVAVYEEALAGKQGQAA